MTDVLVRMPCEDTQRRWPCNEGGRDCNYTAMSQGTSRIASNCQKLEETRKNSSLEPLEGAWPTDTLISDV